MDVSSSSASGSGPQGERLIEILARNHAAYIALPEGELCPASRSPSPTSNGRVLSMKARFTAAVNIAGGDPTNPKWGYVSRMVQLGCTSRKYKTVEPGIRLGDGKKVSLPKDFKWELPKTDEEWAAFQRRWDEAVAEEEVAKKKTTAQTAAAAKTARTSKYFQNAVTEEVEEGPRSSAPSSKADVIREKIERWQAQVVTVATAPDASLSQEAADGVPSLDKDKAKERPSQTEKVQASLGFRVVKRSSVTSGKAGSSAPSKTKVSPAARVPTPPDETPVSSPLDKPAAPMTKGSPEPPRVSDPAPIAHISDLVDCSFLPPSFPSHLNTSTPPPDNPRHKPYPIPMIPCSPPPSSPLSLPSAHSFDSTRPNRSVPQQASSSQPVCSPIRKPTKRARTSDPAPEDISMDHSSLSMRSPSGRSPVTKKTRRDSRPQPSEQTPGSSGLAAVPPSTPPPDPSPAVPVTPVSRGKGLGNARGLPVPSTPNPQPLPTLTELLASSRRSRPRPRPPSRKNTPHGGAPSAKGIGQSHGQVLEADSELPVPPEAAVEGEDDDDDDDDEREHTPEPSPSKTYFSSPASGSTDSPGSVARRALSPVSPLFADDHLSLGNHSAFVPRFTSTFQQQQGSHAQGDDPFVEGSQQAGGALARGSSGFLAMGYSSQFDVEGHVEQVSELLERDVDFNGWLRDLGPEEAEDPDQSMAMSAPSQSQDAGAVGVGC